MNKTLGAELKVFIIVSLLYIAYVTKLPVSVLPAAGHDDGLFLKMAESIYNGSWLGQYNNLTFIKGHFFAIFLAINKLLGLSYSITIAVLNIIVVYFLVDLLKKLSVSNFISYTIAILMLFDPENLPFRVLRDNLNTLLVFLLIISYFDIYVLNGFSKIKYLYSGVLFSMVINTREEWYWIIPVLILPLAYATSQNQSNKKIFKSLLYQASVCVFISVLMCTVNYVKYGFFGTSDVKNSWYSKSYSLIKSVESTDKFPYIPVSEAVREKLYDSSPSFYELKNFLEGDGKGWINAGCDFYKKEPYCKDYAGGWFMWAYRDAVASIGKYKSYTDSESFYKKIYDEVEDACSNGKLVCHKHLDIPVISNIDSISSVFSSMYQAFHKITFSRSRYISYDEPFIYSIGSIDSVNHANAFINSPMRTRTVNESINSAIFNLPSNEVQPSIDCSKSRVNVNDNVATFNIYSLNPESCNLYAGDVVSVQQLVNIRDQTRIGGKIPLVSDVSIRKSFDSSFFTDAFMAFSKLYNMLASFIFPIALLLSICICFVFFRSGMNNKLHLLILMFFIAMISRITLLALVDATTFPALSNNYMHFVYSSEIVVVVLTIYVTFMYILRKLQLKSYKSQ